MKKLLILMALMVAAPAAAHDCCCGGMDRLSAETVRRMELGQLDANANEARREFKRWGDLLNAESLDSPWYAEFKARYEYWADRLHELQGGAIDAATWERIDADMDEALDAVYKRMW